MPIDLVVANASPLIALFDDAQATKCARSLGIPTLGAGAVLVLAKRHGFLPSVTEALTQLQKSGLWLSDRVIQILKDQAGEHDWSGLHVTIGGGFGGTSRLATRPITTRRARGTSIRGGSRVSPSKMTDTF